jgi:hypothetical protein
MIGSGEDGIEIAALAREAQAAHALQFHARAERVLRAA